MSAHLELRGLTRRHDPDGPAALDSLDLDVLPGACVALLGPSGSGKTTALRLAAGLDVPDAGAVLLDGRDAAGVPPERRSTSMVFQRPLLFPHLSVLDNVAFSARVAGRSKRGARQDAQTYLDLVQLGGYGTRGAHELSSGQAQRVALARALAARPAVLLMDEPFSALDAALREDMHVLLGQLRAELQPTILLVTHDPLEAAALADTVAVLHAGRLQQHAPTGELYTRPSTLRVARLLGGRNEVAGTVTRGAHRSAFGPVPTTLPDGPAVLVVRQEAVALAAPGGPEPQARVQDVRPYGPRLLVTVRKDDGELLVEVPPGRPVSVDDPVGVTLVDPWVVPLLSLPAGEAG